MALEILTEDGFKSFKRVEKKGIKKCKKILFTDGSFLISSKNHAILLEDGYALTRELQPGDKTSTGKVVLEITNFSDSETYDVINVKDTWSYLTNDVTSHNCAFIEGYDEFFASVYPTVSSGEETKLLMTSTPNGLNHFYKTCKGAKEGTNGYEYVEVMWYDVPGRGEKWKKETLEALDFDMEKFQQEYECTFLGSSGTLISGEKLKTLVAQKTIAVGEGLKQYMAPVPGNSYALIADVSRGKGLDYSTFSIIDVTKMPYQQVCVFRDNFIGPADYASVIHRLGKMYNDAHTLIEINDIGGQVADILFLDFGYESILFTENGGRSSKRISGGFGRNVDRGIRTTKTVKSIGCSILKLLIEQSQLIINDFDTIQELARFSKKGSSYEAESGAHDDMVMTLVLFAWLSDQHFFKDVTDINTLMKLREKTESQIEEELLPFGFINSGTDEGDIISGPGPDHWLANF